MCIFKMLTADGTMALQRFGLAYLEVLGLKELNDGLLKIARIISMVLFLEGGKTPF